MNLSKDCSYARRCRRFLFTTDSNFFLPTIRLKIKMNLTTNLETRLFLSHDFFDCEIGRAIVMFDGVEVYAFYWETATVQTTTNRGHVPY